MTVEGLIIDIDVSEVEEKAVDFDLYPQVLGKELTVTMEASLQFLENQIVGRTPENFGTLREGINHEIMSPFPNLVGRVGSSPGEPYAIVIEKGRRPGARRPPVDAIRLWVVRKLQLSGDEADEAAEAIAWYIHHHGFSPKGDVGPKGARMFEKGLAASEPHIRQLFASAVSRANRKLEQ